MIKLKDILLNETDVFGNAAPSSNDVLGDLEKEMAAGAKDLEKLSKSKSDVAAAKADVAKVDEGRLNEVLGTMVIFSLILAAPKVLEMFFKAMDGLRKIAVGISKGISRKDVPQGKAAAYLIEKTHKLHDAYVKIVYFFLWVTGLFAKGGYKTDAEKEKAAELVFYVIIAGMAVYSGVAAIQGGMALASAGTAGAAAGGHAAAGGAHAASPGITALETGLAALKTAEVKAFVIKLGFKI